jgi:hypothetical protein
MLDNLDGLIDKETFSQLKRADIVMQLEILDEIIAVAEQSKSRTLLWEANIVRDFIEQQCVGSGEEQGYG